MTIEYIDSASHKPVFRDRDQKMLPPIGGLVRFPSDKVWRVTGVVFDYHTNPELWVCVIVEPYKP